MGITPYQIKKSLGLTNGLRRKDSSNTSITPEQIKADLKAGKYDFSLVKKELEIQKLSVNSVFDILCPIIEYLQDKEKW